MPRLGSLKPGAAGAKWTLCVSLACVLLALGAGACQARDSATEPGSSITQAVAGQASEESKSTAVSARKVIRKADLEFTVNSLSEAQRKATDVAKRHGGYVVSSSQRNADSSTQHLQLTLRVKASELDVALSELRSLNQGESSERVSSEDVTEEWIDLEARLKTQKALEAQYLEILKSATTVADTLAVQKQLADVRTEIEKMDSRRRFLDKEVNLSTINVSFKQPAPLVRASVAALGEGFTQAGADVLNVGGALVVLLTRLIAVLIPMTLLVFLPGFYGGRWLLRRVGALKPISATAK